MSLKTLPLLFINLGGEMMYILDQRLRAQSIPEEKARKVLHDIIGTMLNRRFMDELFKPQDLYSKKAMRTVFDRLAHASIMRLNNASMDKLYDLMTMAFKYQVSLCVRPTDIILVTLNHLDALRSFVSENSGITQQVEHVYKLLIQHYASLTPGEFMLVRQTLLNFFQDMHIRVSIFLKDKVQNTNGRFVLPTSGPVPYGAEVPGSVKLFNSNGEQVRTFDFQQSSKFGNSQHEGSLEYRGHRVINLGTNMYSVSRPLEATVSGHPKTITSSEAEAAAPNPLAKAQLDLLSHLIGSSGDKKPTKSEFRLNLFSTEEEEQAASMRPMEEPGTQVINIDASKEVEEAIIGGKKFIIRGKKKGSAELNRIMGELKVSEGSGSADRGDDLLDLMDSAE